MYKKPYEEKPNTGSFFANKTKTNPKAPDYRGKLVLDLSTYDVVNGNIIKTNQNVEDQRRRLNSLILHSELLPRLLS